MRTVFLLLAMCLVGISCGQEPRPAPSPNPSPPPLPASVAFGPAPDAQKLSMVRLLADPLAVNKKLVAVMGYLDLELESKHFCLHKEDARNNLIANCLWISVPETPEVRALNHRYVIVVGVVTVGQSGQWGLFDLSLQDVRALQVIPASEALHRADEVK